MSLAMAEDSRMILKEDLLRAPHRKRKTAEEIQKPRIIKMIWDIDAEATMNGLVENIGIGSLTEEDVSSESQTTEADETGPKPTPPMAVPNVLLPPGAPKLVASETLKQNGKEQEGKRQQTVHPLKMFADTKTSSHAIPTFHCALDDFDSWSLLSDEVMLYLFTWLPKSTLARCARVCKRWNRLVFDESLWRRLDLSDKTLQRAVLGRALDRGTVALRLCRAKIKCPLYAALPNSTEIRANRLQFLDCSMAIVSLSGLQELLAGCQHLRKLSLESCEVNDVVCRYVAQNRNMEVLNLCMTRGITENGLVPLCNGLKQLDSLNVAWTGLGNGALVYLIICLPSSLTKLNISGCRETLQDNDVLQLCKNCPSLKELDLSDATELTSKSVNHICDRLHHLEYLALSRCYKIEPSSFVNIRHIPTILALDVFGMLKEAAILRLREMLTGIEVNKFPFSSIARPTTGIRRTSIWGIRVRDAAV